MDRKDNEPHAKVAKIGESRVATENWTGYFYRRVAKLAEKTKEFFYHGYLLGASTFDDLREPFGNLPWSVIGDL